MHEKRGDEMPKALNSSNSTKEVHNALINPKPDPALLNPSIPTRADLAGHREWMGVSDGKAATGSATPIAHETTMASSTTAAGVANSKREETTMTNRSRPRIELFERPRMHVLDNVSAISLDEFWNSRR